MPKTIAAVTILVILAVASWLAVAVTGTPEVVPASAPSTAFSAERAMEHVRVLASAPRPVGSAAHDRAMYYLEDQLRELGLEPHIQETVAVSSGSWGNVFGRVFNVVARLPGLDTTGDAPAVLLLAHYDSVQSGPGASDDAVGSAVLLETVRALREGQIPQHDVIVLFTDAEEAGLLGAEGFATDHPWADRIGVVLNFEARGTRGPALMFETGADNRWLIERFAESSPYPVAASYSYEVYRRLPNDTDYSVFRRRGVPGLNFAHIHGAVGYHTTQDSIERLDLRSLQHHGENALALARELGDAELPAPGAEDAPRGDAVYFNPLGSSFVHFPASWVPVLAGLLVLAALAVVVLALVRRRLGIGGLLGGFFSWLAIVAVAVGLGMAAVGLLFPIFFDFRIWGDGSSVAWKLFAWVLFTLGLAILLYRVLRRWLSAESLAAGGLLLWTLAGGAIAFMAPGASYLFLVPLVVQVLATGWFLLARPPAPATGETAAAETGATPPARMTLVLWFLLTIAGAVTALVWASTLGMVAVGLQFGAVVAAGALAVLLLALLAPQVEAMTGGLPGPGWLLGAVLVVGGIALVVIVQASAGFGPGSPRPTSLLYAVDPGRGEAVWATFERQPSEWTREVVPAEAERAPLPQFLGRDVEVAQAPAPVLDVPTPAIEVTGGEGGSYRARVVPPPGAGRLRILLEPASALTGVRVDGHEARLPDGGDRLSLLYYAPARTGVELEVSVEEGAPAPELAAIAQWLRLPDEAMGGPGPRPPELMPTGLTLDTDVTMSRSAVRLDEAAAAPAPEEAVPAGEADETGESEESPSEDAEEEPGVSTP